MATHFMYNPLREEVHFETREFDEKVDFLKVFVKAVGRASLRRHIKIPIQAVRREEIPKVKYTNLARVALPRVNTFNRYYDSNVSKVKKRLPFLENKQKIRREDFVERVVKKKETIFEKDERIYERDGDRFYRIPSFAGKERYKFVDPFLMDSKLEEIRVENNEVFVKYKSKIFRTGLKFKDSKEVNKLLRYIGKVVGVKVSEREPMLNFTIPEGFRIFGNYGTKYAKPRAIFLRHSY